MESFIGFVENRISDNECDRTVRSAVRSFVETFTAYGLDASNQEGDMDLPFLQAWIASMIIAGLKPASRRKYLSVISSLYKDYRKKYDGEDCNGNPFDSVRELASADVEAGVARAEANLSLIPRLLNLRETSSDHETAAMFLWLLFLPDARLQDLVSMRFGDPVPDIAQLDDIVTEMGHSGRKKYVFGLGQGKRREGQIERELLHVLSTRTGSYGLDFGPEFSRDSVTAIWMAAAFRAGIPASAIRAAVGTLPDEYSHLQYIPAAPLTDESRIRLLQKVADTIHDGASRWFVMRMRAGRTPDDIKDAIGERCTPLLDLMSFYYPTRTVMTTDRRGKRRKEERPYLPGILFFRLRRDRVAPLFRSIGDLAWCYRWTNTPESPYCAISLTEMKVFQRHVGSFTPDVRMELGRLETPLSVDDTVRISGYGMLDNRIGVIRSVKNSNGTRTYTLALSSRDYASWTVKDIEEVYLEPVG